VRRRLVQPFRDEVTMRALLIVLAATSPALADPAPATPARIDAICRASGCAIYSSPGDGPFTLCIAAVDVHAPAPKLEVGKAALAMTRNGGSWCAPATPGAVLALRDGKDVRPIAVRVLWSLERLQPLEPLGTFKYLVDLSADARKRNVFDQLKPHHLLAEQAEPVPKPDNRRIELSPFPDDRAYLDVVAVGDDSGMYCTGVALTPTDVLTAAHCVPATRVALAVNTTEALEIAAITETRAHPTLDVALLKLAKPLTVTPRPRRRAGDSVAPAGIVRTVGFGVDDPLRGSGFGIKRRADVPVSGWGCDAARSLSAGCAPAAEMVIAAVGGRDTCWGDSGGPVLEPDHDTWRLIAVTSRPTLHGGSACGRGGIYVRVDRIDEWLTHELEVRR
jgi:hypothetical protein